MGGTVSLSIRFPDGIVESFHTWTNWLPNHINDVALVNSDIPHFKNMVKMMEDDGDTRGEVAPSGYGLVVIDLKEKFLLSMQGYTTFGCDYAGSFIRTSNSDYQIERCKKWIEASRAYISERSEPEQPPVLLTSFDEITEMECNSRNKYPMVQINYDLLPITYIEFPETKAGGNASKNKLKNLGFEINDSEWKNYFLDIGH